MKSKFVWLVAGLLLVAARVHVEAHVPLNAAGDGHDTVPVSVDGQGPYPFILDTGADSTAVYRWFAARAHLKAASGGDEDLSGQTGTARVSMYRVGELAMDGHRIRNVVAYGLPDRHDAGREAGILGNDFMDGTVVVFDFPCRQVEVHKKPINFAQVIGAGLPPVLAGIDQGTTLLTIPVSVNGFVGIAAIDTGSRNTRLTSNFARGAGVDADSPQFRDGTPIYGANSSRMVPREGSIGTVSFAGMAIANASAQVIDLPMLKQDFAGKPAMLLGADLLGQQRFVYDHAARKIWLRPSTCKSPARAAAHG